MKKLITLFGICLLLASMGFAAAPPTPMPVVFGFVYDGQPVNNFQVELILGQDTIKRSTNKQGQLMVDVGTGSPDFPNSKNIDLRTAKIKLNCGFSVCNKEWSIWDLDTPYEESFVLAETPPVTCPTCDCSCSGGGSGGVIYKCTEDICESDYPCADGDTRECTAEQCEKTVCPAEKICPPEKQCEICDTGNACPIPEEEDNAGAIIISILGSLLAGGLGGWFFTKNKALGKNAGLKIYMGRDGTEKLLHKHPGILGYHNPETHHRDLNERHPKGQLFPKYEKDASGIWMYKG